MNGKVLTLLLLVCAGLYPQAAHGQEMVHEFKVGAAQVQLFQETDTLGKNITYYSIDGGRGKVKADYTLHIVGLEQDPISAGRFNGPPALEATDNQELFIIQFHTQSQAVYRDRLQNLGVRLLGSIPNYAHVVRMSPSLKQVIEQEEYVRWVGAFHPGYRVEKALSQTINQKRNIPEQPYHLLLFDTSEAEVDRDQLLQRLASLGIEVNQARAGKRLLVATMDQSQMILTASFPEVAFVNVWTPYEKDMDKVREFGGANILENETGFTGQGIRGEVFDAGFNVEHQDFQSRPLIQHGAPGRDSHGAATSGIVFGDGAASPDARGLLPDAQGIVANADSGFTGQARYDLTLELLEEPYRAMFQTSSVGSTRTTEYTALSAEHDTLLFDIDVVHFQSQSNAGNRDSRPQAWCKNVISGGAFYHQNTLDPGDDCWCSGASIGPASDGRIKPDLSFFYDATRTTTEGGDGAYTNGFGGTSGATPSVAGHGGLFLQMWVEGVFGNEIDPEATPFENRPHAMLTKAAMIAGARQYEFTGESHDMTRVHQGWGVPDLMYMKDRAHRSFFVNETDLLSPGATQTYHLAVQPGEAELKISMVYLDPAALPSASVQRINNLDLKVMSPSGTTYWGNQGLRIGNYSTPNGSPDRIDTVENVFIADPEAGMWQVEIIGSEIIADNHLETPALDADFALAVFGAKRVDGFYILADSTENNLCGVGQSQVSLDLGAVDNFSGTVTFALEGLPSGSSHSFTQTTATAPAQLTLTLQNTGNAPAGNHQLNLVGVSAGDRVEVPLIWHVGSGVPSAPGNLLPGDMQQPDYFQPEFSWDDVAGALEYNIEIADNVEFQSPFIQETTYSSHFKVPVNLPDYRLLYWRVRAVNSCGAGAYSQVRFIGPARSVYPVESFSNDNDLDQYNAVFTPNNTEDQYVLCGSPAPNLPYEHNAGTVITLDDDAFAELALSQGFRFYGRTYNSVFVGSNGFLTFGGGDTTATESASAQFSRPRISGLFDDLLPGPNSVTYQELPDRMVVSFDCPQFNETDTNQFQIELRYGTNEISITWNQIDAPDGIAGLSSGSLPEQVFGMDLTDPPCSLAGCLLDLNGDDFVNDLDFGMALDLWMVETNFGDASGNGHIDVMDMTAVILEEGPCAAR